MLEFSMSSESITDFFFLISQSKLLHLHHPLALSQDIIMQFLKLISFNKSIQNFGWCNEAVAALTESQLSFCP